MIYDIYIYNIYNIYIIYIYYIEREERERKGISGKETKIFLASFNLFGFRWKYSCQNFFIVFGAAS